MFEMTTSGSSGVPVGFYRSAQDEAELSATWFRVYQAYGCSPFSSEVNIG
jgi:phenylacetate-coenzyme A ligase PaaK-like adenylate-forming protein